MSGVWLVSYLVLWILVGATALAALALAREADEFHRRLEAHEARLAQDEEAFRAEAQVQASLRGSEVGGGIEDPDGE